ncbi:hypothetical protein OGM63_17460 [Plectonema radiosum NIES-515]|uniref:Uncharacterized protein n=1 Tax=Plectonema radiosum NIES-515 TaxID=2986073 RepID=A0ABT3B1N0_9CYAN|nr:hypothetical protein [Plectonema radiosum NIES-515]
MNRRNVPTERLYNMSNLSTLFVKSSRQYATPNLPLNQKFAELKARTAVL